LAAIEAAKDGATYLDPQIARLVMDNLKAPAVQPNPNLALLSEREMEVLKLIVEGKSNAEIAEQLYLSTNTIKTHVRGIMNKLAVDDRVQAAVIALRSGIV
jgi:DNA-binding NarL/FixJ family response regulator